MLSCLVPLGIVRTIRMGVVEFRKILNGVDTTWERTDETKKDDESRR